MTNNGDQSKWRKNYETPPNIADFVKMTVKCFNIKNTVLSGSGKLWVLPSKKRRIHSDSSPTQANRSVEELGFNDRTMWSDIRLLKVTKSIPNNNPGITSQILTHNIRFDIILFVNWIMTSFQNRCCKTFFTIKRQLMWWLGLWYMK